MATPSILRRGARPQGVCLRCFLNPVPARSSRKAIHQSTLKKRIEAEYEWKAQAQKIKNGEAKSMLSFLEERGYVKQVVGNRDGLDQLMINKRVGAYCGIDPTAPSMHIGHMIPFMMIFWMYMHGLGGFTLLGSATVKVGDPTGRNTLRDPLSPHDRKSNLASIHLQLKKMWWNIEFLARKYKYEKNWAWTKAIVTNGEWWNKISMVDILRDLGNGVRLGTMLGRDTVKQRMASSDGMSFAEFCYPLMQSWDFWHLYNKRGVQVQVGGSDQYGNILAGMDAVNYIRRTHSHQDVRQYNPDDPLFSPYGITTPLMTTATGEKLGKSAGNAVWLDPEMTSSYDLYGYLVRFSDDDVERYLKLLTFMPLSDINMLMEEHRKGPEKRLAQHKLAREVLELVHSAEAAKNAQDEHLRLHSKNITLSSLLESNSTAPQPDKREKIVDHIGRPVEVENQSLSKYAPQINPNTNTGQTRIKLPRSLIYGVPFPRILYHAGLVVSKSEGHRLVAKQAGAYVGSDPGRNGSMPDELKWLPIRTFDPSLTKQFVIEDKLLLLRVGKWKIKMVTIVSDKEFDEQGLDCPGWQEFKQSRAAGQATDEEFLESHRQN